MTRLLLLVVLAAACSSSNSQLPGFVLPPEIELPEVVMGGYEPATGTTADVVVSRSAISVRGTEFVSLDDGVISAAELERGVTISKLAYVGRQLAGYPDTTRSDTPSTCDSEEPKPEPRPLLLAFDRRTNYGLLINVVASLRLAGNTRFAVLARAGGRTVQVPIDVHYRSGIACGYDPAPEPLWLHVLVSRTEILLWSNSRQEPKRTIIRSTKTAVIDLGATLSEIVQRRWPRERRNADRKIVFMAVDETSMQDVAELLGTLRAAPDGKPLFPDVEVSSDYK